MGSFPGKTVQLRDGENKFFVTYEIAKPTATNGLNCNDAVAFTLITFAVGDRVGWNGIQDAPVYKNAIVTNTITKYISYNTVNILNLDNGHNGLNKTLNLCLNQANSK